MDRARVDRILAEAIEDCAFPGAAYAIGSPGWCETGFLGTQRYDESPAITAGTLWDLASVTKVVSTTTLAVMLCEEGKLDLDLELRSYLPEFTKPAITPRHLLLHNSGLPPSLPNPTAMSDKREVIEAALAIPSEYEIETDTVYSDVGFHLLGHLLEALSGASLEVMFARSIADPIELSSTRFTPYKEDWSRCAPTSAVEPWRVRLREERGYVGSETWIQGEVHDPTVMAMGGVGGSAGLFSTIPDLIRFCEYVLEESELFRPFTIRHSHASSRALGWDTPYEGSSAGTTIGARGFGHTGFTGTSIWFDPDLRRYAVLLTNRVHPINDNQKIKDVRTALHDAAFAE